MSEAKLRQSIENLERALLRLGEALAVPLDNPLAVDGTIQRLEFALELTWKTLRRLLELKGRMVTLPRDTLKEAYTAGWLDNEDRWLEMLRNRNETSHIYDEEMAKRIYDSIKTNFPEMQKAFHVIVERSQDL